MTGPTRRWTAGRPVLGLHVGGVGLTRCALFAPLHGAPLWLAALLTYLDYRSDPTGAHTVPDDHTFVLGPALLYVASVAVLFGVVASVIAGVTLHRWGRWLTTRHRPAPAPSPAATPAPTPTPTPTPQSTVSR